MAIEKVNKRMVKGAGDFCIVEDGRVAQIGFLGRNDHVTKYIDDCILFFQEIKQSIEETKEGP